MYGYLDQLTYMSSRSMGDVTTLSLFGASELSLARQEMAQDLFDMTFVAGSEGVAGPTASTSVMDVLEIDAGIQGLLLPFYD